MEIGDSFEFENWEKFKVESGSRNYGRRHYKNFVVRGNRVWRTEFKEPHKGVEMSKYKVDKNIPMPPPLYLSVYPWRDMEVGDSFKFEDEEKQKISDSAYSYGRRNNKKFAIRGNRVWRIE